MKHVVMFSGGIGSWAAAKRVAEEHGTDNLILLFTDTLIEDADTYRFLIEAAVSINGLVPGVDPQRIDDILFLVKNRLPKKTSELRKGMLRWIREEANDCIRGMAWIADGRTPWEVFRDTRSFPRNPIDMCSRHLKREFADAWIAERFDPGDTVCYVGLDWSEIHRYDREPGTNSPKDGGGLKQQKAALGWRFEAPLCNPPYLTKHDLHNLARADGLEKQRLYVIGMQHANCGGGCIKMGMGGFARLYYADPEQFAEWEAQEESLRRDMNLDLAILRDRKGGESRPLTLRELRERITGGGKIDMFDIGGCGCMVDEPSDEILAPENGDE